MKNRIQTIFREACVLFTLCSLVLYAVGSLGLLKKTELLSIGAALLLFCACVLVRIAARLFCAKLPIPVRVLLFFLCTESILFLTLGFRTGNKPFSLVMFTLLSLLYTVFETICFFHRSKKHTEKKEE